MFYTPQHDGQTSIQIHYPCFYTTQHGKTDFYPNSLSLLLYNTTWPTNFYPNSLSLLDTTQHGRQTSIQIHYPCFTQHNMTDKLLSKFIIPAFIQHNMADKLLSKFIISAFIQHNMTDKLLSKFIIPALHNTTWPTNFYPNSLSLFYTTPHGRQTSIQIHYPCFTQHNMADTLLSKFIIPALHNTTWQTNFYPNSLSLVYTTPHGRQTSIQIHYPCFTQHNMADRLLSKFIIPALHNTTWPTNFYPNSLSLVYTTQHGRQTSIQIHYPCFYTTQHGRQTSIQIHYPCFYTTQHDRQTSIQIHYPCFYTTQHDRQASIQIHYPWFIQHNMADKLLSKFIIPGLYNTTWQTNFYPNSLSLFYKTQHGKQTSIQIHYLCFTQHNMTDKLLSKFIIPGLHNTTWQTNFYPNSLSLFYTTQHGRQTSIQIHYPWFTQHNMTDSYPNS